jgi:response regulator of citrate/malate metabolism
MRKCNHYLRNKPPLLPLLLNDIRNLPGLIFINSTASLSPVIFGMDDPEMVKIALDIGAYGYIVKPFKFGEPSPAYK